VPAAPSPQVIAVEQERPLSAQPPERVAVSVVTIGELCLGILAAESAPTRAKRLETLSAAETIDLGPPMLRLL